MQQSALHGIGSGIRFGGISSTKTIPIASQVSDALTIAQ
jgi:hypothetical protein